MRVKASRVCECGGGSYRSPSPLGLSGSAHTYLTPMPPFSICLWMYIDTASVLPPQRVIASLRGPDPTFPLLMVVPAEPRQGNS